MNISGTDKQKYLRCLNDIGKLLYKTSSIFQAIEKDFVRKQNISTSQAMILVLLAERHASDTNMSDIVAHMNLEKSTVTRLVDSLVRREFVVKSTNAEDRRETVVLLSAKGRTYASELKQSRMDHYRAVLERLPRGRVREVMSSFELLVDAFDAAARKDTGAA